MNKIAIIGSPGSGKSTLAIELGQKLSLPVHHLDRLFHKSNWEPIPKEEFLKIQNDLIRQEKWIIDGNYQGTLPIRLAAADTIIMLSYSKKLCLYRALKRIWVYRNKLRPDRADGCDEKIDLTFLKFILQYPKDKTLDLIEQHSNGKQIFIFTSPNQADSFLNKILYNNTRELK